MTNTASHESLMDLIDAYAEARHRKGLSTYNVETQAARQAVEHALNMAPQAAPQQESTASNESAYQRGYMDGMAKGRRDAEAAPQQEAGAVPQGWKAVPVNPTPEMWKAAKTVPDPNPPYPPHYGLVWDAMLAAAPSIEQGGQHDTNT